MYHLINKFNKYGIYADVFEGNNPKSKISEQNFK